MLKYPLIPLICSPGIKKVNEILYFINYFELAMLFGKQCGSPDLDLRCLKFSLYLDSYRFQESLYMVSVQIKG